MPCMWPTFHGPVRIEAADLWTELREGLRIPDGHVHFLHTSSERSGEDFMIGAENAPTVQASSNRNAYGTMLRVNSPTRAGPPMR